MQKINAEINHKENLTDREAVVLKHLCQGETRKQIAKNNYRSYGCISKQIESIAEKLQASNSREIIVIAIARGMIKLSIKSLLILLSINATQLNIDIRRPSRPPSVKTTHSRQQYS